MVKRPAHVRVPLAFFHIYFLISTENFTSVFNYHWVFLLTQILTTISLVSRLRLVRQSL